MTEVTITLDAEFDNQLLFDIFVTALEGGIGYWSVCSDYHWQNEDGTEDLDGFYATIQVHDDEEVDEYRVDADVLRTGLLRCLQGNVERVKYLSKNVRVLAILMSLDVPFTDYIDYDAGDADQIVQCALFGEVVYG
jgi:hypothetical protein